VICDCGHHHGRGIEGEDTGCGTCDCWEWHRTDRRRTCRCGHRSWDHFQSGPCAVADTPIGQVTGQGCQCHAYAP